MPGRPAKIGACPLLLQIATKIGACPLLFVPYYFPIILLLRERLYAGQDEPSSLP